MVGDRQRQLNLATAGAWSVFASHRAHLWSVVVGAARALPDPQRLCLLGAGNVNDVDLRKALTVFEEVHLVDLDAEAMRGALVRQGLEGDGRIVLRAGIDFRTARFDGESFAVVVSCCVLSQIIDGVVRELGPEDPRTMGVVLAERDGHLANLVALTAPGGAAVLVTDFVSSDTAPGLSNRSDLREEHVAGLVAAGNFFTGCNPYVLQRALQALPTVAAVAAASPWVWRIGLDRSYAVAALVAHRTGQGGSLSSR
ncbi:MAG: hypothetical protein ACRDJO_11480 [Actinomycetota bacterium]